MTGDSLPGTPYDAADPALESLRQKTFDVDMKCLAELVAKVRAELPNRRIIFITLAGLYTTSQSPTPEDVKKGYATAFTPNLAAWWILSEEFNQKLRRFAGEQQVETLDFEKAAETAFVPRGKFLDDTVHLSADGYLVLAQLLANKIRDPIVSAGDRYVR